MLLTSVDSDHNFYALAQVAGARGFVRKEQLAEVDFTIFWPAGPRGHDPRSRARQNRLTRSGG